MDLYRAACNYKPCFLYSSDENPCPPRTENTKEILEFDNISDLQSLDNPSFLNFVNDSMDYVDVIVKGNEFLEEKLEEAFAKAEAEKSDYLNADSIAKIY